MNNFIHFKDIIPEEPTTWKGKKILSLDIDWANDEVLEHTLNYIERANIKACFFVTHDTPLLQRIINNPLFEVGLHPNFNDLIDAKNQPNTASQIIDNLLKIIPNTNVLRSHSMTTSGRWIGLFKQKGITHLSNYIQYGVEPIVPFRQINNIVETPVYFADDGYVYLNDTKEMMNLDIGEVIKPNINGIKVYNFHPIHLFINTTSFADYNLYKETNKVDVKPENSNGAMDIFKRIIHE